MKKRLVILCAVIWAVCVVTLLGVIWLNKRTVVIDSDPESQRIRDLIVQLGFEQWSKRVEATEELKQIGEPALPLLFLVVKSRDDEVRARVRSIVRHILTPPSDEEMKSWQLALFRQLESSGIKPPPEFLAVIEAPAPPPLQQVAEPPPPLPPPQVQDGAGAVHNGGGGGMNIDPMQAAKAMNPGNGMLSGMMGGGLGGLMGGGGGGGGALGGIMGLTKQMFAMKRQQMLNQRGGGGGARNIAPPERAQLQDLSLNLLDSVGVRLTEDADGLRVTDVRPGTPASTAGLRPGDVLTKADGRQLKSFDDAKEMLVGKSVKLDLLRHGEVLQLAVNQ